MIGSRPGRLGAGLLLLLVVASVPAVGAGATGLSVLPGETTADPGERVTVDIVVDDASGGVGAWEATVNLSNGAVADIVDVRLHGDPGFRTVDVAADNDSVYLDAALANTTDTGPVTIATMTIEVAASGRTNVNLRVEAVGDEQGAGYDITGTDDATIEARGSSGSVDTSTETTTDTDSSDDSSGLFGDTETSTDGTTIPTTDDAGTVSATSTADTAQPTDDPDRSDTASPAPGERDTDTTTTTSPGFTAIGSLLALLGVALLRRR